MGFEQNRLILARLYFKKAAADLESAKSLLEAKHYANTVFLAQQSADKAAKAVLALKGMEVREHVVSGFLASEVLSFVPEEWEDRLRGVIRDLVSLEEHTIRPRYPIVTPARVWDPEKGYDGKVAVDAVDKATRILRILTRLAEETLGLTWDNTSED